MTSQSVLNLVQKVMPNFRLSRQKSLAVATRGCIERPHGRLTDMARGMESRISLRDRLKRISRFLGNTNVEVERLSFDILQWLVRRQGPLMPVVVLIDWTREHSENVLMLSIKWRQRSIPFYWKALRDGCLKGKLVAAEAHALDVLRQILPDCAVIVIADRGFERKEFYQALMRNKLDFIVRSKGTTKVQEEGQWYSLSEVRLFGERVKDLGRVVFSKVGKLSLRVVGKKIKVKGIWSRWYLTTSLQEERAEEIVKYYERRMGIEATFKDLKTTLGWRQQWLIKDSRRLERYLLILVMAMIVAMITAERKIASTNRIRVSLDRAWRGTRPVSFVQLGLWMIQEIPSIYVMIHPRKPLSYVY